MEIILASTSPRRIELMGWLGIPFRAVPSLFDEKSIRDTDPERLTQELAKAKARSVIKDYPGAIIIGSDLVVEFEGQILEKIRDTDEQRRMLKIQRGKEAKVITSVYIVNTATGQEELKTVTVPYKMTEVTDEQIEEYIKSGQGRDKAGGFGLQDSDGMFTESIDGCYSGVLGFPLCAVSEILKWMGVQITAEAKQTVKEKTGKEC